MEGDLQFDESVYSQNAPLARRTSVLANLVIKLGLAADERGAQRVLLIIAVLAVIAAIAVQVFFGSATVHRAPTLNSMSGATIPR